MGRESGKSEAQSAGHGAYIAEIVRRYDVIAIQEVKWETSALRMLLKEFLEPGRGLIVSDVSASSRGNAERLGFIYDV